MEIAIWHIRDFGSFGQGMAVTAFVIIIVFVISMLLESDKSVRR